MRNNRYCMNCGEPLRAGENEVCDFCLEPKERQSDIYQQSAEKISPNRRRNTDEQRDQMHS